MTQTPFDDRPASALPSDEAESRLAAEVNAQAPLTFELGGTGLKRSAGYIDEEFLPQLRGRKAIQVYKEMSLNDPLIGAMLHTITMLLRNVEWTVKPGGKTGRDKKAAEHVESCMDDMEVSWDDFITEALTMLVYGWSWHEIVYKRRGGQRQADPRLQSKHRDGLIGWRKLPIRAQETLVRWIFDESGSVAAMVQMPPPTYKEVVLPIQRSMLFHYKHHKGNPEGISMLRNAYRPWYMKKRIEEFEAVGVERDLAGLPIVKVPSQFLSAAPGTKQRKAVDEFRKMIKSVRRNEQEGLVFPIAYDQDTKQPLYSFELLGSGGGRAFSTDSIIQRYEQRILMSVLADFIMVGHQSTGSYSLHTDKTGIFRNSLNAIAKSIAETLNRQAIPRLMRLNGIDLETMPEIVPTDVDAPDITQLAGFMAQLAGMGVTWFPDAELEKFVRDAARLPQLDEDAQKVTREMGDMQQQIAFAQKQAEFVQAKMAAQQAMDPNIQQAQMEQAAAGGQPQPGAGGQPGQEAQQ